MDSFISWLSINYIETIATLASVIYVIFSVKQSIWLWPFGLLSSLLYVYTFYEHKIYADMGLYVYYVIISVYGWYYWSKPDNSSSEEIEIKSVKDQNVLKLKLLLAAFFSFIIISQILVFFTDSNIPYIDAFTTSLSFVATWMLAKKYLEHWYVWIFVDIVSSGVYFYKELYVTVFLFIGYTVMAFVGLKEWSKDFNLENK